MLEQQTTEVCDDCNDTHPVSEGITHYENEYTCPDCGEEWTSPWCCMCDDECPSCGHRNISPNDDPESEEIVAPIYAEAA